MRFICLGCLDKEAWGRLSVAEQAALVVECTNFDQELAAKGHFAAGYALQDSAAATTVRWAGGKATRTDGPFAETKEILFSFYVIDVEDLDAALEWAAKMPCAEYASVEVRPLSAHEQAAG